MSNYQPQGGWPEQPPAQGGQQGRGGPGDQYGQGQYGGQQGGQGQYGGQGQPGGYGGQQGQQPPYGQSDETVPRGVRPQGWQHPQQQPPGYEETAVHGSQSPAWQDRQQPPASPSRPPRRRHRGRRWLIALLVLIIVLVGVDFGAKAFAENAIASQIDSSGLGTKPSVDIEGFPFLTQVAAKDFKKVVVSASNIPAGPVTISSLNATITGMHLNSSWNGATIDRVTATAFVSLSSLTGGISSELGDAASLTAVPDGANKLKVTGTVLGLSASGVVEIKQTGPQQITVELPTTGGLVGTLLGSAASFTITLPAGVPPSLRITGLTINGQGLTLSAVATNATFSK